MKTLGVAVRAFVGGVAGTAGALFLVGALAAWAVSAVKRDLSAVVEAARGGES